MELFFIASLVLCEVASMHCITNSRWNIIIPIGVSYRRDTICTDRYTKELFSDSALLQRFL